MGCLAEQMSIAAACKPAQPPAQPPMHDVTLRTIYAWNPEWTPVAAAPIPGHPKKMLLAFKEGPILMLNMGKADEIEPRGENMILDLGMEYARMKQTNPDEETGTTRGVLSVAADPLFPENNYFYVYYSATPPQGKEGWMDHDNTLARFTLLPTQKETAASKKVMLQLAQPGQSNNGGGMVFNGPNSLYLATGDGGGESDPSGEPLDPREDPKDPMNRTGVAQNVRRRLGKVLAIDVRGDTKKNDEGVIEPKALYAESMSARTYSRGVVISDPLVYAYGFRDPRSLVLVNGNLVAFDRGQSQRSWAVQVRRGGNYGWSAYEGSKIFKKALAAQMKQDGIRPADVLFEYEGAVAKHGIIGTGVYGEQNYLSDESNLYGAGGGGGGAPGSNIRFPTGAAPIDGLMPRSERRRMMSESTGQLIYADGPSVRMRAVTYSPNSLSMDDAESARSELDAQLFVLTRKVLGFAQDGYGDMYVLLQGKLARFTTASFPTLHRSQMDELAHSSKQFAKGQHISIMRASRLPIYSGPRGPRITQPTDEEIAMSPDAWFAAIAMARSKSYTALAFSNDNHPMPTSQLGRHTQPGGKLWNVGNMSDYLMFPMGSNRAEVSEVTGGIPLYLQGKLVGAVGVAGGLPEEDEALAIRIGNVFDKLVQ